MIPLTSMMTEWQLAMAAFVLCNLAVAAILYPVLAAILASFSSPPSSSPSSSVEDHGARLDRGDGHDVLASPSSVPGKAAAIDEMKAEIKTLKRDQKVQEAIAKLRHDSHEARFDKNKAQMTTQMNVMQLQIDHLNNKIKFSQIRD